jgi:hypothetical protein
MLQIITDKEDHKAIAIEMYSLAAEHFQVQPAKSRPDIMTGEQVCVKLDINIQTLTRWRKKGKIPYLQIGSAIRYDFNKVVAAIEVVKLKRV